MPDDRSTLLVEGGSKFGQEVQQSLSCPCRSRPRSVQLRRGAVGAAHRGGAVGGAAPHAGATSDLTRSRLSLLSLSSERVTR